MATFHYRARDGQRTVSAQIDAPDESSARALLEQRKLQVERLELVRPRGPSWSLSAAEGAEAGIYLAELVDSGMPLLPGLRAVAEELAGSGRTRRLAATFHEMADHLEAGQPLDVVVDRVTSNLPDGLRGVIQAGVKSGRLGESLSWFVDRQQLVRRQRRQVFSIVAYPLLLLTLTFAMLAMMVGYGLPSIEIFLDGFGAELPMPTPVFFTFMR